jgi:hypothetical protein
MGFLSKIFKPVSKVLDKIVPNEVKPLLPYAAAFAPMLLGPGIMGSSMLQRGLMSGGLNLGAQLAQDGSEGDVNMLSALMAGGIGALSAPGTDGKIIGVDKFDNPIIQRGPTGAQEFLTGGIEKYGKDSAMGEILGGASKASKFLTDPGLMKYAIPVGQGAADNAYADAQRALRDYENSEGGGSGYAEGDQNRGLAVRRAMERGGHDEQTIQDMLESLGYEDPDPQDLAYGGRVNAMGGGIMSNQRMNFAGGGMDYMPTEPEIMGNPAVMEMILPGDDMRENRIMNSDVEDVADYKGFYERKNNPENYDEQGFKIKEEIKEPNFGGIEEAVESIEEKEFYENGSGNSLLDKVAVLFIDEKGDWRSGLQRAKYELSEFISGKGFDLTTGAEWYNKLPLDVQREILEEKIKYREMRPDNDEERREFTMSDGTIKKGARMYPKSITEMPVYDEADAGKFGYGAAMANGGIMNGYNMGGSVLPKGMEMDYRGGGFIPMGSKERADDVPARVSKNEFVMTADAVKAAGGGSVNEGARRMYNLMNNLEARA